jgi:phage-related protein
MSELLTISFLGNTLSALREFPDEAKREAGYQLDRVQQGLDPEDWKPMKSIGPGVREIRIREKSGAYRVIYVTRQTNRLYVLHAFQKKTEKTAKPDLELAKTRYRSLLNIGELS